MNVVSFATAAVPSVPPSPSGSSAYTAAQNSADERSAFGVSRSVSWNSGANVATTSMPYADQHMKYSHTRTSGSRRPDPIYRVLFELSQSPVTYGRNMRTNGGRHSSPPVT